MRRREFIAGLGSAAACPLVTRAQQPAMPIVGLLDFGSRSPDGGAIAAFRKGLAAAGFVEGRGVTGEYHTAGDHMERLPALAADLVRRRPAAIIASTGIAALAAKATTRDIPIIFFGEQ